MDERTQPIHSSCTHTKHTHACTQQRINIHMRKQPIHTRTKAPIINTYTHKHTHACTQQRINIRMHKQPMHTTTTAPNTYHFLLKALKIKFPTCAYKELKQKNLLCYAHAGDGPKINCACARQTCATWQATNVAGKQLANKEFFSELATKPKTPGFFLSRPCT